MAEGSNMSARGQEWRAIRAQNLGTPPVGRNLAGPEGGTLARKEGRLPNPSGVKAASASEPGPGTGGGSWILPQLTQKGFRLQYIHARADIHLRRAPHRRGERQLQLGGRDHRQDEWGHFSAIKPELGATTSYMLFWEEGCSPTEIPR